MPKFRLTSSKPVLKTPIFEVTHDHAVGPGGVTLDRKIIRHPGATVILAVDEGERVLLIRQYRLPLRRSLWELPAGTLDAGETPLRTAKRELREETGYRAKNWRKLCRFWSAPGFCDERITAYEARGLTPGTASPEPYELIEPRWIERAEALAMVADGRILDAKTMLTLLYAGRLRSP